MEGLFWIIFVIIIMFLGMYPKTTTLSKKNCGCKVIWRAGVTSAITCKGCKKENNELIKYITESAERRKFPIDLIFTKDQYTKRMEALQKMENSFKEVFGDRFYFDKDYSIKERKK